MFPTHLELAGSATSRGWTDTPGRHSVRWAAGSAPLPLGLSYIQGQPWKTHVRRHTAEDESHIGSRMFRVFKCHYLQEELILQESVYSAEHIGDKTELRKQETVTTTFLWVQKTLRK